MFSFRWQKSFRPSRQQIIVMMLLVGCIAALLPIPLIFSPHNNSSPSQNGKDHSRPFPCQDRPCGCRTAEQCKKKCCCFSAEQKMAWAKKNGVKSSEVVEPAAKCKTDTLTARKACCSSKLVVKVQGASRSQKSGTKTASRYKWVIGVVAQECQGVSQTLSGQPVFLIPPIISLNLLAEPTGERFILAGTRFVKLYAEPPVPPPRLVAA